MGRPTRWRRIRARSLTVVLSLAVVLPLTACSDDGALSHDEFLAEANAACAEYLAELAKLEGRFTDATEDGRDALARESGSLAGELRRRLSSLRGEGDDARLTADIRAAYARIDELTKEAAAGSQDALEQMREVGRDFEQRLSDAGLKCRTS